MESPWHLKRKNPSIEEKEKVKKEMETEIEEEILSESSTGPVEQLTWNERDDFTVEIPKTSETTHPESKGMLFQR